jgi:hypothetical protein
MPAAARRFSGERKGPGRLHQAADYQRQTAGWFIL